MNYEEREATMQWLNKLQTQFHAESWRVNGIVIWPLIKNELFSMAFKRSQVRPLSRKSTSFIKISSLKVLLLGIYAGYRLWRIRISQSPFTFSGAYTHRILSNGESHNRYFDPLINYIYNSIKRKSYLLEYSPGEGTISDKYSKVIILEEYYNWFKILNKIKKTRIHLKVDHFHEFIEQIESDLQISSLEERLVDTIQEVLIWKDIYTYFLKRIQPVFAFGICYYNKQMFGMNLACHDLSIKSVDIQHGGQGVLHHAYSSFCIPKQGSRLLPNIFWCWEETSANDLNEELAEMGDHYAIAAGNPANVKDFDPPRREIGNNLQNSIIRILYTLQPIYPLFDEWIIRAIKGSNGLYIWTIRSHPRMNKDTVLSELKYAGISNIVRFEDSVNSPIALKEVDVHISKYSGTILEASILGIPSIIIDEIGVQSFKKLIQEKKAFKHLGKDAESFLVLVEEIASMSFSQNDMDFRKILDDEFISIL